MSERPKVDARTERMATNVLQKMYRDYQKEPSLYFSCGLVDNNVFHWRVTIIGQSGTRFSDCILPAELIFPEDFPMRPPMMKFLCPMFHPNIGEDGKVCISILHEQKDDPTNEQEQLNEKWLPVHTIETIVISVICMLGDPNPQSPLNVKANRVFIQNKDEFWKTFRDYCNRGREYAGVH